MGRNKKTENSGDALGSMLEQTASMVREKVGELGYIREISNCGAYLENRELLVTSVCRTMQEALGADACGLFGRDGQGAWVYLGGYGLDSRKNDPQKVAENLLDNASNAIHSTAHATSKGGDLSQTAIEMRHTQGAVGSIVITAPESKSLCARRDEFLSIALSQISTLLAAAWMFSRIKDTQKDLKSTLSTQSEMLEEAKDKLHQQEKLASLGQLVTGVSHELNNRLVPVLGYAQLLQGLDLPDAAKKAADSIEKAALGGKQIVDDLLSFAKPQQPNRSHCQLDILLRDVCAALKISGVACPITLQVEAVSAAVNVDPRQTEQVFHNLIKNAVQAVENKPDGQVTVSVRADGEQVSVTVEDNGTGMSEAVRRRIFEPFYSTKGVGQGTGLGLSLTYGLIRANGGEIQVDSRPDEGSRFTVIYPAGSEKTHTKPKSTGVVSKVKDDVSKSKSIEKQRLLIVDDEDSIREFLVEVLGDEYEVTTAGDGRKARKAMQDGAFDVVLMDIRMPRQGGVKLFEWVEENSPDTAPCVVFMTGDQNDRESRTFLESKENPTLAKPFTLSELTSSLKKARK